MAKYVVGSSVTGPRGSVRFPFPSTFKTPNDELELVAANMNRYAPL
jgi:hypothetical protein